MTPGLVGELLSHIPDAWLAAEPRFANAPAEGRAAYAEYLLARLALPRDFLKEAVNARAVSV